MFATNVNIVDSSSAGRERMGESIVKEDGEADMPLSLALRRSARRGSRKPAFMHAASVSGRTGGSDRSTKSAAAWLDLKAVNLRVKSCLWRSDVNFYQSLSKPDTSSKTDSLSMQCTAKRCIVLYIQ